MGLIATQNKLAALLTIPEGEIVRMLPGDTLPDGRILLSITDNSLTLQGEGQPVEMLTLFPRLSMETDVSSSPVDFQGSAQSGDGNIVSGGDEEVTASQ